MHYPDTQLFIGGHWCDAADGRTLAVHNPATGEAVGRVAHASTADLDRALEAARRGFATWRAIPAHDRAKTMRKAAGLLRERADTIARWLTLEQGKPLGEAKGETLAAADVIDWFADEGLRVYGRLVPSRMNVSIRQMVLKDPVGPVAAFTPWNFPINQVVRKVSAALTTGCSIIVKGPEETPAAPAALVRAFVDAGVPEGVIGLVYGDPAAISSYLIPHPVIRKVTFTGSTAVGKQLAALAGQHMKRVTMELGGHAPVIVADDADVALAVKATAGGKFRNAGQVCIAPTRFLVHRQVEAAFCEALAAHASALTVGDGLVAETRLGPLANERRLAAMVRLTDDARARGARVLTGGARVGERGHFFAPTVLADVPTSAAVFNEEPFGPIASVRAFDTLDEAIAEANRSPYGLAAYAYTTSIRHLHRLSEELEVGQLWVNQPALPWPELPFGGVKDSGYGSEGGPEALDAYLFSKTVAVFCG